MERQKKLINGIIQGEFESDFFARRATVPLVHLSRMLTDFFSVILLFLMLGNWEIERTHSFANLMNRNRTAALRLRIGRDVEETAANVVSSK